MNAILTIISCVWIDLKLYAKIVGSWWFVIGIISFKTILLKAISKIIDKIDVSEKMIKG